MDILTLPPTAQTLAEVIGTEKTLALARRVSCRSLYIPQRVKPGHWLREVLGDADAERLAEEFPGFCLPLARCSSVLKRERNERIAKLAAEGATIGQISVQTGVNKNTVQTILYRMKAATQASV